MSYSDLMRARLFEPLGMSSTTIQDGHALVVAGKSQTGLPVQPWIFDAYAPAGAAVSTTADLVKLATGLLDRAHHKAVVVLSDLATEATTDLGIDLLARNS